MKRNEIKRIAKKYTIAVKQISQWRDAYGRNKWKPKRPKGMLSVGDIRSKYGIQAKTLALWRRAGLPNTRGKGKMVLIKETDLLKWIERKRKA